MFGEKLTPEQIEKMEPRIKEAMKGWRIEAYPINKTKPITHIPGTWGAEIYPYKYFEIYKKEGDPNPGEAENEIQCYLSCGWVGCDDEVLIILCLLGESVLDKSAPVTCEIYKCTGADIKVFKDGKLVTNFKEKFWKFFKRKVSKAYYTVGSGSAR